MFGRFPAVLRSGLQRPNNWKHVGQTLWTDSASDTYVCVVMTRARVAAGDRRPGTRVVCSDRAAAVPNGHRPTDTRHTSRQANYCLDCRPPSRSISALTSIIAFRHLIHRSAARCAARLKRRTVDVISRRVRGPYQATWLSDQSSVLTLIGRPLPALLRQPNAATRSSRLVYERSVISKRTRRPCVITDVLKDEDCSVVQMSASRQIKEFSQWKIEINNTATAH